MRRPPEIMLFLVIVVASASAMSASGLAGKMGVSPDTGIENEVDKTREEMKNRSYSANRKKGEINFIGSIFSGIDKAVKSFVLIYSLYEMFVNIGLPPWLATFISSPIFLIMGIFMIYMISGRRMTVR